MKNRSIAFATLLAALSGAAHAQTEPTSRFASESAYVGGGAAYAPRYAGSKDYRPTPLVEASVLFKNGIFADTAQGVGYRLKFTESFYATAALGLDPGRKDKDDVARPGSDYLHGMGDIKATALANVGVGYRFGDRADLAVLVSKPLGHTEYGMSAHLIGHVVAWRGDRDSIDLSGTLDAGNRDYNQTYFGVSTAQAASSRFAAFRPGNGLYAASASATWTHQFNAHWFTRASLGATRYLRDAGRSPIVQERTNYLAAVSLAYRF
ncbi:MipA/OmpV family protein [Dyella sp. LX-66]|uniref:MipA/OmpV family protein n=1 Tax=unclassified Dyella TaxID=2634549 RepID=UPI001BE08423|nr:MULTISPECIES: MipA/OmpV family protein [unclassified Dyella]MBT2116203.1 MipA/OmpV family protein [Dyella sp. LX-1]MBT2138213.1 MipA/OmpV family protein [Dyella sp. LX-66]